MFGSYIYNLVDYRHCMCVQNPSVEDGFKMHCLTYAHSFQPDSVKGKDYQLRYNSLKRYLSLRVDKQIGPKPGT